MASVRAVIERVVPEGTVAEVESVVERIRAAGRAAWPAIALADDALAERVVTQRRDDPEGAVVPEHDADYYLAVALTCADRAALAVFEAELVPQIAHALRRLRIPGAMVDEVQQLLRIELLMGDPPRITDYGGRGALAAWLRVTATRRALKLLRAHRREETLDDVLLAASTDGAADPELHALRTRYAAELKHAVTHALGQLEVRQRNLLRQHVIDGLTIDELARIYRVHRATCARWLAEARASLARETRRHLTTALGVAGREVESVLRLLDSDIEVSITRLLRKPVR